MIETILIALGIMFILTATFLLGVWIGAYRATDIIYNSLQSSVHILKEKAAKEAAATSAETEDERR